MAASLITRERSRAGSHGSLKLPLLLQGQLCCFLGLLSLSCCFYLWFSLSSFPLPSPPSLSLSPSLDQNSDASLTFDMLQLSSLENGVGVGNLEGAGGSEIPTQGDSGDGLPAPSVTVITSWLRVTPFLLGVLYQN